MATSQYQLVAQQALSLSPREQLQLIKQLADQLSQRETKPQQPRYLIYGEFRDTPGHEFATEEDFKLAEWHLVERTSEGR